MTQETFKKAERLLADIETARTFKKNIEDDKSIAIGGVYVDDAEIREMLANYYGDKISKLERDFQWL